MVDEESVLPTDMLRFIDTPVAQPLVKGRNVALFGSGVFAVVLFILLRQFALSSTLAALFGAATFGLNLTVVWLRFQSHASTPWP